MVSLLFVLVDNISLQDWHSYSENPLASSCNTNESYDLSEKAFKPRQRETYDNNYFREPKQCLYHGISGY